MIKKCSVCGRVIQDDEHETTIEGVTFSDPIYESYSTLDFPDGVRFRILCVYCEKEVPTKSPHEGNMIVHDWVATKKDYDAELPNHQVIPP